MATPAMEATIALRNLHLNEIYSVYPMNLPTNTDPLLGKTVALVTEVTRVFTTPGNNDWADREDTVQVQIFFATGYANDPEKLENLIIKGLKQVGYRVQAANSPHTVDPDTRQLTATYKFTKMKGSY